MQKLVLGILLTCCNCSFAQSVLDVRINNLKSGTAYLLNTDGTRIDTVIISNNSFSFNSYIIDPTLFYLKIDNINEFGNPIRLILSSKKTVLVYNQLKPSSKDSGLLELYPNQPTFKVDPNHSLLLSKLEKDWISFSDEIGSITPDASDEDKTMERRKKLYLDYIAAFEKTIEENPDKVSSAVAIYEYLTRNGLIDIQKTIEFFDKLTDEVKYSSMGVKIAAHINKETSLGINIKSPYFEFKDFRGNTYSSNDFVDKKILLHFWSSTCGPCRIENTEVKKLQEANEKSLAVINVSLDAKKDQWVKALTNDGLSEMINTCDFKGLDSKIAKDYYIHGIPGYYLINEGRAIMAKGSLAEIKKALNTP